MKIKQTMYGFTLIEVLVVVSLLGILAAFGVNYYNKTVERARARDAVVNLTAMHSANEMRKIRQGSYWPTTSAWQTVSAINAEFDLEVVEDGMIYDCRGTGALDGTTYRCRARRTSGPTYRYLVTQAAISDTNPWCAGSNCPFN